MSVAAFAAGLSLLRIGYDDLYLALGSGVLVGAATGAALVWLLRNPVQQSREPGVQEGALGTEYSTEGGRFWPAYIRVTILPLLLTSLAGGAITMFGLFLLFSALAYGTAGVVLAALVLIAVPWAIVGSIVGGIQWRRLPSIYRPVFLPRWGWISISVLVYEVGLVAAIVIGLMASSGGYIEETLAVLGVAIGGAMVVVAAILGLVLRLMLKRSKPGRTRANPPQL